MDREQGRIGYYWIKMWTDRKEIEVEKWGRNGLGIRFLRDWRRIGKWLVECDVEVLY